MRNTEYALIILKKGTLEHYLKDIDKDVNDVFDKVVKQLTDSEGINEELKSAKNIFLDLF